MRMKARIRLIIEEEFEYNTETVVHDTLPSQIDNFRGLSRQDQHEIFNRINSREEAALKTRVGAAKRAEELAKAMVNSRDKIVEAVVEEVCEVASSASATV